MKKNLKCSPIKTLAKFSKDYWIYLSCLKLFAEAWFFWKTSSSF